MENFEKCAVAMLVYIYYIHSHDMYMDHPWLDIQYHWYTASRLCLLTCKTLDTSATHQRRWPVIMDILQDHILKGRLREAHENGNAAVEDIEKERSGNESQLTVTGLWGEIAPVLLTSQIRLDPLVEPCRKPASPSLEPACPTPALPSLSPL